MSENKNKKKVRWNNPYVLMAGICLVLCCSCNQDQKPLAIEEVFNSQVAMYPVMDVQDWYKLLHQAAMGNRHLGVDDSLIYAYLLGEWERIEASVDEPLIEYISPDSSVVRLNLRPFKASGGAPDDVFASMKKTWDSFVPSETQFEVLLGELREASRQGMLEVPEETVAKYIEEQRRLRFPAVHHSEEYEANYRPAYRVLERRFIP